MKRHFSIAPLLLQLTQNKNKPIPDKSDTDDNPVKLRSDTSRKSISRLTTEQLNWPIYWKDIYLNFVSIRGQPLAMFGSLFYFDLITDFLFVIAL